MPPAAAPRRDHDVATHRARDLLDRRQPESGAAKTRSNADIGLRERPEQPLDLVERETDAAVRDRKRNADLALGAAQRRYRQRDEALLGEFRRIVDQVFQRRA